MAHSTEVLSDNKGSIPEVALTEKDIQTLNMAGKGLEIALLCIRANTTIEALEAA